MREDINITGSRRSPAARRSRVPRLEVRRLKRVGWAVLLVVFACCKAPLPYPEQIEAWHAEKDAFMRESGDSPVPAERRAAFPPLAYFPTDGSYRVPAMLQPAPDTPAVEMPTSTGQRRQMRRVGTLSFTLKGQDPDPNDSLSGETQTHWVVSLRPVKR